MLTGGVEGQEGATTLIALRERGKAHGSGNPGALEARAEEILPTDDLTIIYTSGTTGPPKGVVTRHSNYAFNVTAALKAVDVPRGSMFLQFLPLAHSLGRIEHFLAFDAMAVSSFARSLQTVAEDLAAVRPEIMVSVPRLYEKFYARVLAKVEEDGGLKKAIFEWALGVGREASRCRQQGGEPKGILAWKNGIADRLVFRRSGIGWAAGCASSSREGRPCPGRSPSSCTPSASSSSRGTGSRRPPRSRRSTASSGTSSAPWGRRSRARRSASPRMARSSCAGRTSSASISTIRRHPGVDRTGRLVPHGDIGVLDEEGFLRITDRKKDIIVTSGGKNIAPQNLENLLKNDRYVSQAFVYGDRKKYLIALLTLAPEEIVPGPPGRGSRTAASRRWRSTPRCCN